MFFKASVSTTSVPQLSSQAISIPHQSVYACIETSLIGIISLVSLVDVIVAAHARF
jgi:hypothetical protein